MVDLNAWIVFSLRSEIRWQLAYSITLDTFRETKYSNRIFKIVYTCHIFLHCASIYKQVCHLSNSYKQKAEEINKAYSEVWTSVKSWLYLHENDSWKTRLAENFRVIHLPFLKSFQIHNIK